MVIGNHDGETLKNAKSMAFFESVDKMMHVADEDKHICLCHFPIAERNGYRRGAWHIHGHIHGREDETYEFMKTRERALNVGCMINDYVPATLSELIRNNRIFREVL